MEEIHLDNKINENTFITSNEENKDKNILDKKLYQIIINNKEIFNIKYSKIIPKDDFFFLIETINKLTIESCNNFFSYLNTINHSILKILFFCYIEYDLEEKEEKNILEVLSKIIGIYFHKKMFHFI